jgi:hypothetical protein
MVCQIAARQIADLWDVPRLVLLGSVPVSTAEHTGRSNERKESLMTSFDTRLGELDRLLAKGDTFSNIEVWIEGQPIDDESKTALWLTAWSEQPRTQRREMVAPRRYVTDTVISP